MLFDTQTQANGEQSYHLTREGGHSHRRILHAADATGKAVETTLVGKALAHPNIRILERSNAVDLIISDKIGLPGTRRVVGAWIWNRNKEKVETCSAKSVVLATGGGGESLSVHHQSGCLLRRWYCYGLARPAVAWPTSNSTSFTPPPCTIHRRAISC
ncbi:L-aspartate oxidase [Raoultella planticola]|uniref:L-aspartate oxidase n=1 Tax=Raoultella planticola TaxID=575 RepID=A0A485BXH3_RAOPL|nr:L-aspartate oxidase [Raoultella planticola]